MKRTMQEWDTLKMYGKTINCWEHACVCKDGSEYMKPVQYEVAYTEYDRDGNVIRKGTEDFSADRIKNVGHYIIWTWNGVKYNRGGHRFFEAQGSARIERKNVWKLKAIAAKMHPDAAAIDVRKTF